MKNLNFILIAFLFVPVLSVAQSQFASATITFDQRPRILIVFDENQSDVIELKTSKAFANTEARDEAWIENQVTINKMLSNMTERGYKLVNVEMINSQNSLIIKYYLFEKTRESRKNERD